MATLEKLVTDAKRLSRYIIEEIGEEHQPTLLLDDGEEITVIQFKLSDTLKEDWQAFLPALLRHYNAQCYLLIIEGWATKTQDPKLIKELEDGRMRVSNLPPDDRTEVLVIQAVEKGGVCQLCTAEIKLLPDNKRQVGEFKEDSETPTWRMIVKDW